MTLDYGLWNAVISTVTLLVIAGTAFAALRQIRQLRAQTTLAGLLKVLDDYRDPEFQRVMNYVRIELPAKIREPGFLDDFDGPVDRMKHPEVSMCEWYEQIGSYLKHGLLDERMRRTRGDTIWENFEYMAVRGVLFQRANPDGCYPRGTPRMAELGGPEMYGQAPRDSTATDAEQR